MYSMMEATSRDTCSYTSLDNDRDSIHQSSTVRISRLYEYNVGGAGGFTRGMIEALELPKKPTHVLLMDDDVMVMPESLFRTYYLLRLLKDEYKKCFLSGAMFDYDIRQKQYEDVGFVHKADDHTVRSSQLWI